MTAETAIALPALFVVLGACIWGMGVATLQARCITAARSAALAAARGEAGDDVAAHVARAVGSSASLTLTTSGTTVSARVALRQQGFAALPGWPITAVAYADLEPTAALR